MRRGRTGHNALHPEVALDLQPSDMQQFYNPLVFVVACPCSSLLVLLQVVVSWRVERTVAGFDRAFRWSYFSNSRAASPSVDQERSHRDLARAVQAL